MKELWDALLKEHVVQGKDTRLDVVFFPGNQHTVVHIHQVVSVIKKARQSINFSMYVITDARFVEALLAIKEAKKI